MLDMTNDYAQNMAIFNQAGRQAVDKLFAKLANRLGMDLYT